MLKIRVLLCFLSLFLLGHSLKAQSPVIIDDYTESINPGRDIELLVDPSGELTINDLVKPEMDYRWFESRRDIPNFGFTKSTVWGKFTIDYQGSVHTNNYILELSWPLINSLEIYSEVDGIIRNRIATGNNYTADSSSIIHRNFLFQPELYPGETKTIYLKIQSEKTVQIPLKIYNEKIFFKKNNIENYILGIFFGTLLVMILYNFFLFLAVRWKSYLLYVIYICSQLLYNLIYTGLGLEILWANATVFNNIFFPISISFVTISALLFVKHFLNLKSHLPGMNRVYNYLIILSTINIALPFAGHVMISVMLQNFIIISGSLLIIVSSIRLISINRTVKTFLVAWVVLLSGAVSVILKNYGLIPSNLFTNNYVFIAIAAELILLSFALADRIKIIEEEKNKALSEALRLQKESAKLENEIEMAETILRALLPESVPDLENIRVAFKYKPMMRVGGDFVNILYKKDKNKIGLFICDVSGHGVYAALIASMVNNALEFFWDENFDSPSNTIHKISRFLKGKMGGNFVTGCLCIVDLNTGLLTMANAGHPALIILRENGVTEIKETRGSMINDFFKPNQFNVEVKLNPGDTVVLYTDGIIEAENPKREFLSTDDKLFAGWLNMHHKESSSVGEFCENVYKGVIYHTGTEFLEDDFTIIAMEYRGGQKRHKDS